MVIRPTTTISFGIIFVCLSVIVLVLPGTSRGASDISANSPHSAPDSAGTSGAVNEHANAEPTKSEQTSSGQEADLTGPGGTVEQKRLGSRAPSKLQKQLEGQSDSEKQTETQNALSSSPSLFKAFTSLLVVLGLIVVFAYIFKRFALGSNRPGNSGAIEIIARTVVNPKQSLCLVKLGERLLLVGLSPNHIAALTNLDDPEEIVRIMGIVEQDSVHSVSNTFSRLFHREANIYDDHEIDEANESPHSKGHWNDPGSELASLVDKVKGLTKLRFRS